MGKKISILSFSARENGNCEHISDFIAQYHNASDATVYRIGGKIVPCSDCNYECLTPGLTCPQITHYLKHVIDACCNSEMIYYVVPNFCGYPCASYFAYAERSIGYFSTDRAIMGNYRSIPKRFIIVSNTENESFKQAMRQQVTGEPEILYLKTSKYQKQSIAGDILDSTEAKDDLTDFLMRNILSE